LRRHLAHQIGPVRQVGEEGIEFGLDLGREAAEQAGDEAGETEDAGTREGFVTQPRLREKSLRKQVVAKAVNDVDI